MTPEDRADILQDKYGPYIRRLKQGARDLLGLSGGDKKRRYIRLVQIADAHSRVIHEQTPCRRGCSSCCHMATPIPLLEAEKLAAASGKQLNRQAGLPAEFAAWQLESNVQRFSGVACPFLVDRECSVYRDRPVVCRSHHVLEETSEKCDMRSLVQSVAHLDSKWLDYTLADMTMDEPFADIRDWFPGT